MKITIEIEDLKVIELLTAIFPQTKSAEEPSRARADNIFNNIRNECAEKGKSISALAAQIGIGRKTFYYWQEKGDLPLSAVSKIADILGIPMERLLQAAEEKTETA